MSALKSREGRSFRSRADNFWAWDASSPAFAAIVVVAFSCTEVACTQGTQMTAWKEAGPMAHYADTSLPNIFIHVLFSLHLDGWRSRGYIPTPEMMIVFGGSISSPCF